MMTSRQRRPRLPLRVYAFAALAATGFVLLPLVGFSGAQSFIVPESLEQLEEVAKRQQEAEEAAEAAEARREQLAERNEERFEDLLRLVRDSVRDQESFVRHSGSTGGETIERLQREGRFYRAAEVYHAAGVLQYARRMLAASLEEEADQDVVTHGYVVRLGSICEIADQIDERDEIDERSRERFARRVDNYVERIQDQMNEGARGLDRRARTRVLSAHLEWVNTLPGQLQVLDEAFTRFEADTFNAWMLVEVIRAYEDLNLPWRARAWVEAYTELDEETPSEQHHLVRSGLLEGFIQPILAQQGAPTEAMSQLNIVATRFNNYISELPATLNELRAEQQAAETEEREPNLTEAQRILIESFPSAQEIGRFRAQGLQSIAGWRQEVQQEIDALNNAE